MFRATVLVAAEGFTFNGLQLSGRGSVPTLLRFGHKRGSVLGTLVQLGQLELDPSPPRLEELPVKQAAGSVSATFTMCLYAVRACCSALKEMGNAASGSLKAKLAEHAHQPIVRRAGSPSLGIPSTERL